jgi:uncharacterized membrane protein YdjX (TVP38/TMEM64 family)
MQSRSSQSKRFFIWTAAASILLGALWIVVSQGVTIKEIQQIERAASDMSAQRPLMVFVFLAAVQALGMAFGLPTKALLTLLAGALLGIVLGSLATFVGVLIGASVLFITVRHFLRERVSRRFSDRARKIEKRVSEHPIRTMIGLRLFIALPYGPCTISAALSSMSLKDFLLGSAIGDIPVIALYSIAGQKLFTLASASEALSTSTVVVLIAIGAVFILSAMIRKNGSKISGKTQ